MSYTVTRSRPSVKILSGLPGSGKSRLCEALAAQIETTFSVSDRVRIFSSDSYFVGSDGVYRFDRHRLEESHAACLRDYLLWLNDPGRSVLGVVDNTNLSAVEIAPYLKTAQALGSAVEIIRLHVPDPVACWKRNVHGVPLATFLEMERRLSMDRPPYGWPLTVRLAEGF